jgi:hypothetical protein
MEYCGASIRPVSVIIPPALDPHAEDFGVAFHPAVYVEIARGIKVADIAGVKNAVQQISGCKIGPPGCISQHHVRAGVDKLALDATFSSQRAVVRLDLEPSARNRQAGGI